MSQRKARKIGIFSALSICIGSVVGIGIFLKNASVGANVDGNGWTWIMTWAVAGVIALLVAVHFGKISKLEVKNSVAGLSSWADEVTTEKQKWFHKIVSFNYGFFYLSILTLVLSFFTTELLINFLNEIDNTIKLDVWAHVLISLGFLTIFITTNFLSYRVSGWIASLTVVLKFIPLLLVVIVGIILPNVHNITNDAGVALTVNGFNRPITFAAAIQGMMLSIPSVLFAFDAFIGVGALTKQVKGGDKTVSLAIVFGMLFVTVIYVLIALASSLHFFVGGRTFVVNVLKDALPAGAAQGITVFVALFLFISAYGTTNAITAVTVKEFEYICQENRAVFTKSLVKKFGARIGGLILLLVILTFWSTVTFVPAIATNSDAILDGMSNLVVVYFFIIYITLIYMFWKNVYLKNELFHKNKSKAGYTTLVWVTILSVSAALLANFAFVIIDAVQKGADASSWGLFVGGSGISNLYVLVAYLIITPAFLLLPFINSFFMKKGTLKGQIIYKLN